MFHLRQISLFQFKNYQHRSFDFAERIVGICGKNGVGKTNLLDAIHYLCFTRSYFTRLDANNVRHGHNGFRLEGDFLYREQPEKAVCILRETGKKEFSINNDAYEKFSQHIGRYPCVVIAPDDAELITGDSRERRSFLDALLSQLDTDYLQQLIVYKKVLDQRNAALKSFADSGSRNYSLLDVLDEQLIKPGDRIYQTRRDFLFRFLPEVKHLYQSIAGANAADAATIQREDLQLLYESQLEQQSMAALLQQNRQRDCLAQRTTTGVHRDELLLRSGEQPFKNIASQGQRKSLLFALKLAEMDVLKKEKGFPPLLLLDDVFEKLDEDRISNLLHRVCVENEGQVFITDTNETRLAAQLEKLSTPYHMISL
ncbi:MAG: DNA replication and repair protein RecF [Bacteroidetes bacterium]|nr:DNA replication and repair protein RecF [Bacteroidota bacterium]